MLPVWRTAPRSAGGGTWQAALHKQPSETLLHCNIWPVSNGAYSGETAHRDDSKAGGRSGVMAAKPPTCDNAHGAHDRRRGPLGTHLQGQLLHVDHLQHRLSTNDPAGSSAVPDLPVAFIKINALSGMRCVMPRRLRWRAHYHVYRPGQEGCLSLRECKPAANDMAPASLSASPCRSALVWRR